MGEEEKKIEEQPKTEEPKKEEDADDSLSEAKNKQIIKLHQKSKSMENIDMEAVNPLLLMDQELTDEHIAEAKKSPLLAAWILSTAQTTIDHLESELEKWRQVVAMLEEEDVPKKEEKATKKEEKATKKEEKATKKEEKAIEEKPVEKVEIPEATDLERVKKAKPRGGRKRSTKVKKMNFSDDKVVSAPTEAEMKAMEKETRAKEIKDLKEGKKVASVGNPTVRRIGSQKPMGMGMPPGGLFGGGNPLDALKKNKSTKNLNAEDKDKDKDNKDKNKDQDKKEETKIKKLRAQGRSTTVTGIAGFGGLKKTKRVDVKPVKEDKEEVPDFMAALKKKKSQKKHDPPAEKKEEPAAQNDLMAKLAARKAKDH